MRKAKAPIGSGQITNRRLLRKLNEQLTVERSDALLLPFIEARDHSIAESLLTQLIQQLADPIIAKILKSKLRNVVAGKFLGRVYEPPELPGSLFFDKVKGRVTVSDGTIVDIMGRAQQGNFRLSAGFVLK